MKKTQKILLLIIIIILLITLICFSVVMFKKFKVASDIETPTPISTNRDYVSNVVRVNDETYQSEVLESDKRVLVEFEATWCEPCHLLSPIVDEVSSEHQNIKFVRVDIDASPEITKHFKITSVPTIAIVESGEVLSKIIGVMSKEKLEDLLDF